MIADIWDGDNLMCTFRRCVDSRLFGPGEVVWLAESLELTSEEDEPIWQFQSSSQSLYVVINFRGVATIYVPVV
jgi:hypothetical protein